MADTRRFALGNQLEIEQILLEAQNRWLRPAEICEILRNYNRFEIAPEPPNMPPSGSLYLFDRKVLRYFRKDGHNWRKKKDGKTVKEAHERLKAGSVDVLHCYYAHGEENENFQRRSYWMLEEELSHIVLVHYREVKGNRTNYNRIKVAEGSTPYTQETTPNSEGEASQSSSFRPNSYQMPSQNTDTSLNSAQASEYEDAESAYNNQASSRLHSFLDLQHRMTEKTGAGLADSNCSSSFTSNYQEKFSVLTEDGFISPAQADKIRDAGLTYEPSKNLDFQSWEDVLQNCSQGVGSQAFHPSFASAQRDTQGDISKQGHDILGELFTNSFSERKEFGSQQQIQGEWQASQNDSSHLTNWPVDQKIYLDSAHDLVSQYRDQGVARDGLLSSLQPPQVHPNMQNDLFVQLPNTEHVHLKSNHENNLTVEGKSVFSAIKQNLFDGSTGEGLKKIDSFNRWMSKELGDVKESNMQSSSGAYWETIDSENGVDESPQEHLDTYTLSPSLSQDQLYSIIDFSPNWAYVDIEVKILITGRFLMSEQEAAKCKWSCMFGEVEVPAEIVAGGVLRCHTPSQKAGRVPFYITCSNRLACSEVREFEYRASQIPDVDAADNCGTTSENLCMRFGKLLCVTSVGTPVYDAINRNEIFLLNCKISSLLKDEKDEWDLMLKLTSEDKFSSEEVKEKLVEKLLKEKLQVWLVQKAAEDGKGPCVLDQGGQGVLHFAAALGYDWALEPSVVAGVNINFRDVNGWTALHWAAYCGRERTVASLISLGAAPGALSDPTPKYPSGRTPADLASSIGHKGIAGYLAESDLSSALSAINLNKKDGKVAEISGTTTVQTVPQRSPTPFSEGDLPYGLSMKDSLAAVRNATQAAARIHQVFRVQSFQKKQLKEYGNETFGISEERALSLLAVKSRMSGHHDEPVLAAAIRIQNKFRSWKGRKDFLIIRQQIIKIQAHVRGHQVRKNYKKIIWSVGIMEKVILRWRRKRSGLRGFKSEALAESSSMLATSSKEDEYDFLKEGRKQKEERLQKALARVKSMVQYPEARDQYRRLLNVVSEIQETKAMTPSNSEETSNFDDDLVDIEALLDDDTFMPMLLN